MMFVLPMASAGSNQYPASAFQQSNHMTDLHEPTPPSQRTRCSLLVSLTLAARSHPLPNGERLSCALLQFDCSP